jgi:2-dehydropantoate 2-reductase
MVSGEKMRIGIIGVGGVGGYFGGKLAKKYEKSGEHEIIFLVHDDHLRAIQKNGLQLFTKEGNYVARPNIATDKPLEAGIFDLVFFCTKSYSLESSAQEYSACINSKTIVIPLLNGVNSSERLRVIFPQANVLGGSVYIVSSIEKPGVVRQKDGACILTFGTDDKSAGKYKYILDILLKAKIKAMLTDKISEVLWTKYLLMCPLGSLTAATGKTYGGIIDNAKLRKELKGMMEEVFAVARARKVALPEDLVDKTMKLVKNFDPDSKTSMQLDKEKGRATEIDALTFYMCKAGRDSRVPTPLHDEIFSQLIK